MDSKIALVFETTTCLIEPRMKSNAERAVDKSRNMEHPGTFRNIPEHEKIKIFFYEKKN